MSLPNKNHTTRTSRTHTHKQTNPNTQVRQSQQQNYNDDNDDNENMHQHQYEQSQDNEIIRHQAPIRRRRRQNNNPVNNTEPEVPNYDLSNGYPKGLPNGEGPAVIRTVNGKRKVIHGVPYEALSDGIQEDLDRNPLDDAGQLRIFIKDSFYGEGSYIEMGSEEHARKFMNDLRSKGRKLL